MIDTPRTDEAKRKCISSKTPVYDMLMHSRTLERELATAQENLAFRDREWSKKCDRLERELSAMTAERDALRAADAGTDTPRTRSWFRGKDSAQIAHGAYAFCEILERELGETNEALSACRSEAGAIEMKLAAMTKERDALLAEPRLPNEYLTRLVTLKVENERLRDLLREIVPPNAPVPIYLSNDLMMRIRAALEGK